MTTELTDEQAFRLYQAHYESPTTRNTMPQSSDRVRRGVDTYRRLVAQGWLIEPPTPRYYVEKAGVSSVVRDHEDKHSIAASFWGTTHPNPHGAAQAEADRLNNQEQSS